MAWTRARERAARGMGELSKYGVLRLRRDAGLVVRRLPTFFFPKADCTEKRSCNLSPGRNR